MEFQAGVSRGLGDGAISLHLRKIPATAQQPVADARCAAAATGDRFGTFPGKVDAEQVRRAVGDDGQLRAGVELQAVDHAEPVVQGLGDQSGPRGGADQREGPEVHFQGLGTGPLADQDVQAQCQDGQNEGMGGDAKIVIAWQREGQGDEEQAHQRPET